MKIAFILPILLIVIAILWMVFPPKTRNYFYGYRTALSMKTQENWKLANHFSSRVMLCTGIVILGIHIVAFFMLGSGASDLIVNFLMITYLLLTILVVPITEIALNTMLKYKKAFGQDLEKK